VPLHQFGEGGLGMIAGKFPHQFHVLRIGHLVNYLRRWQKWTNYFELFFGCDVRVFRVVRGWIQTAKYPNHANGAYFRE
jgi:hypothetical protein